MLSGLKSPLTNQNRVSSLVRAVAHDDRVNAPLILITTALDSF